MTRQLATRRSSQATSAPHPADSTLEARATDYYTQEQSSRTPSMDPTMETYYYDHGSLATSAPHPAYTSGQHLQGQGQRSLYSRTVLKVEDSPQEPNPWFPQWKPTTTVVVLWSLIPGMCSSTTPMLEITVLSRSRTVLEDPVPGNAWLRGPHRRRAGEQSHGRRSTDLANFVDRPRRVATVSVASAHITSVLQGLLAGLPQRCRNQPLPAGVRNFRVRTSTVLGCCSRIALA